MLITPPTDLGSYLREKLAEIERLAAIAEACRPVVEANAGRGGRMLRHWLSGVDRESDYDHYADNAEWFARTAINRLELEHVAYSIRSALQYGREFLGYVVSACERERPLDEVETRFLRSLPNAPEGARLYGYEDGDAANLEDEEYVAASALAANLSALSEVHLSAPALLDEIGARVGATIRVVNMLDGHKWRPEYGEVETVWHASLYAARIGAEGFSATRPAERKGLGSYGALPTISTTCERRIAEDAARCFSDAWDIAHGVTSPGDILGWIAEEGLKIDLRPHFGDVCPETLSTPLDGIKLYRLYLYFTKTRGNPVVANPEELLEAALSVERHEIGVVACEVALDDACEFLVGEAEFRVTPRHVRAVTVEWSAEPNAAVVLPSSAVSR
jgi:hypothetical protein